MDILYKINEFHIINTIFEYADSGLRISPDGTIKLDPYCHKYADINDLITNRLLLCHHTENYSIYGITIVYDFTEIIILPKKEQPDIICYRTIIYCTLFTEISRLSLDTHLSLTL